MSETTRSASTSPTRRGDSVGMARNEILQAIRRGELNSGTQVRQSDWADRLGISRVPVREALSSLVSQGLLEHSSHQGFFVATFTEDEFRQLYALRHYIDREIAASIPWPDDDELGRLRDLADATARAEAARDVAAWLDANEEFMMSLYAMSDQRVFVTEALRLWQRCELHRTQRVSRLIANYDQEPRPVRIVRALERQDRDALVEVWSDITELGAAGAPS